jgi:hypothetical protein
MWLEPSFPERLIFSSKWYVQPLSLLRSSASQSEVPMSLVNLIVWF